MQQRPVVLIFIGSRMIASCLPVFSQTAAVPADKLAEIQARDTLKYQGTDLTQEAAQFDLRFRAEGP